MREVGRIVLLVLLILGDFPSATFAQSKFKRFSSQLYNYSFSADTTVWYKANQRKLAAKVASDSKLAGKQLKYEFLFTSDEGIEPTFPFFIVQPLKGEGNVTYSSIKKEYSNEKANQILQNNWDKFDQYVISLNQDVILADDSLKTISSVMNVKLADGTDVVAFNHLFFFNNLVVQFVFTSLKSDFAGNYEKFKSIINSFDWSKSETQTIFVKKLGKIQVPPMLEVQEGSYKERMKKYSEIYGFEYTADNLVLQQSGLNESDADAFLTYVRVIFKTIQGKPGDFGSFKRKPQYSPPDLNDINLVYKEEQEKQAAIGSKILKWHGISVSSFNGVYCLLISYERQLNSQPPVTVRVYLVENNDKMYSITCSYRTQDGAKWKPEIERVLNSIRFY